MSFAYIVAVIPVRRCEVLTSKKIQTDVLKEKQQRLSSEPRGGVLAREYRGMCVWSDDWRFL